MGASAGGEPHPVLPGMPVSCVPGTDRIPAWAWAEIIGDPVTVLPLVARILRGAGHWWWTGALDGSGHGRFWTHGRRFSAHALGWQLSSGLTHPVAGGMPLIRHASCQRPNRLRAGSAVGYQARRWRAGSPLADTGGARGESGRRPPCHPMSSEPKPSSRKSGRSAWGSNPEPTDQKRTAPPP